MKKEVGYVVAIVGLVVMAVGLGTIPFDVPLLNTIPSTIIMGVGIAGIVVGVVIALQDKSIKRGKQVHDEVPIYEGEGKNRKIVGYQRK